MRRERSAADWIAKHADRRPSETALEWRDVAVDWQSFYRTIHRLARGLAARGVRPGDRVAVAMPNRPASLYVFGACARLGAVYTPLNPRLGGDQLEQILANTTPTQVVAGPRTIEGNPGLAEAIAGRPRTVLAPDHDPSVGGLAATGTGRLPPVDIDPDAPAMLLHTSGTTGQPRGVPHTWRTLEWNHRQFIDELALTAEDHNYCVAPLAHVAGANVLTGPLLSVGGTTVLDDEFDPERTLDRLSDGRTTATFLVPAMWRRVFEAADEQTDLSSLRIAVVGGAPVDRALIRTAAEYDVPLVQGYGMTEAGPMVSLLESDDPDRHVDSVGEPGLNVDVRIAADDGTACENGEVGELWVRGPNVVDEYWRAPEATQRAFRGEWFRTGDLARQTAGEGIAWVGRRDDMIVTGGENVYPQPVEARLAELDDLEAAGVVGTPHPDWGEAVTAAVVPADEKADVSLEALRDTLRHDLADYQLPRRLAILDELPRNPTGKLRRDALKSRIESDTVPVREY